MHIYQKWTQGRAERGGDLGDDPGHPKREIAKVTLY